MAYTASTICLIVIYNEGNILKHVLTLHLCYWHNKLFGSRWRQANIPSKPLPLTRARPSTPTSCTITTRHTLHHASKLPFSTHDALIMYRKGPFPLHIALPKERKRGFLHLRRPQQQGKVFGSLHQHPNTHRTTHCKPSAINPKLQTPRYTGNNPRQAIRTEGHPMRHHPMRHHVALLLKIATGNWQNRCHWRFLSLSASKTQARAVLAILLHKI